MIPEEGQTVERKESLGERREIVETCAAFASAQGGRIYIGVRDNGTVVGVQIGKGTLEGLANDIAQNTVPKLVPAITTVQEAGQTVIVVEVAENPTKPVSAYGRAYPPEPPPVLDLTTEETTPEELVRLLWLDLLPDHVRPELPLPDLLDWIVKRHPEKDTSAVLAGFTALLFHNDFEARFSEGETNEYITANGSILARPVQLKSP